jgi:tyrosinase
MLDRVWWIWQMQDPEKRVNAVPGEAAMPMPPHGGHMKKRAAAVNTSDLVVDLGWTAPPVKLMDLNEQLGGLGGELCYIYV